MNTNNKKERPIIANENSDLTLGTKLHLFFQNISENLTPSEQNDRWKKILSELKEDGGVADLAYNEAGTVFTENLACRVKPKRLLSLFEFLSDNTIEAIIGQWKTLRDNLPRTAENDLRQSEVYGISCRTYVALRAFSLAKVLDTAFLDGGDSDRSRGDLYLTMNDRYYYNFSYLCSEFKKDREDLIDILYDLYERALPGEDELLIFGDRDEFADAMSTLLTPDGDMVPKALHEILPLSDLAFDDIISRVPSEVVAQIGVKAISRHLGFILNNDELLEIFEICKVLDETPSMECALDFLNSLYGFEGKISLAGPSEQWFKHWQFLLKKYGAELLTEWVTALLPVYDQFSTMMGNEAFYRTSAGWMATCVDCDESAEWLTRATTERGSRSPINALSLVHPGMCSLCLARFSEALSKKAAQVPASCTWDKDFLTLVLRHYLCSQRSWLSDRVSDLYLRGGGYELGENRAGLEQKINAFLDTLRLSDEENAVLQKADLHFELLPPNLNIFTGDEVDSSRWASPPSAFKYMKTLLKLAQKGISGLPALMSNKKRMLYLEKLLRRLDFHSCVLQIIAIVKAFGNNTRDALEFLLFLKSASGETPSDENMRRVSELVSSVDPEVLPCVLRDCYLYDKCDDFSLNPGLIWAMRFAPHPNTINLLSKIAIDVIRKNAGLSVAAIDSLDAIGTGIAMSAILRLKRKIRNRKVFKYICQVIDKIASKDGVDYEVFLDYAADGGELESDASCVFNFGTHLITLKLEPDGKMSSVVRDFYGKKMRSFPKEVREANPKLYAEFQNTKKLLVETVTFHVRRLENGMIGERHWNPCDFSDIFLHQPIMRYLGKRILWNALHTDGKNIIFRITESGRAIDVKGNTVDLSGCAQVRIMHPAYCSPEDVECWLRIFNAEKITQPFLQLCRDVVRVGEDSEEILRELLRRKYDLVSLYTLIRDRNWHTENHGLWDIGHTTHAWKHFAAHGQYIHVSTHKVTPDKKVNLAAVYFTDSDHKALAPDEVNYVVISEGLADLASLTELQANISKISLRKA